IDDHRFHRWVGRGSERRAELRHVGQPPRLAKIGSLEALAIQAECVRGGELESAAHFLPGSSERREQRNRANRKSAALAALGTIIQANDRGASGCVLTSQRDDLLDGNSCQLGYAAWRIISNLLA